MKAALKLRLERLEALSAAKNTEPPHFQYGHIKPLPPDFIGERHVVVVRSEPTRNPYIEWCQFEERPGPAPPGRMDFQVVCPEGDE
jgi:hypothetical protein